MFERKRVVIGFFSTKKERKRVHFSSSFHYLSEPSFTQRIRRRWRFTWGDEFKSLTFRSGFCRVTQSQGKKKMRREQSSPVERFSLFRSLLCVSWCRKRESLEERKERERGSTWAWTQNLMREREFDESVTDVKMFLQHRCLMRRSWRGWDREEKRERRGRNR